MRNRLLIVVIVALVLVIAALAALLFGIARDSGLPSQSYLYETTISESDAPGESNLGYLLAGTLLTWVGFFAYAVYLCPQEPRPRPRSRRPPPHPRRTGGIALLRR